MTKKKRDKALLEGCESRDFNKARLAINFGADVRAKDNYDRTPLHRACRWNNDHIIAKLLIDRGADVNAKDIWSRTPLYWACSNNAFELAKLLIERGADVEAKVTFGDRLTLLHMASNNNALEIVKLLIERGADPMALSDSGNTPFDWAKSEEMKALLKQYMK